MGRVSWLEYLLVSKVYIIIVNWNGWQDTIECLESLLLLDYPVYRIIVCDNGSTDESVSMIRLWAETAIGRNSEKCQCLNRDSGESGGKGFDSVFTLIENGANLGYGAGNNVGLRYVIARGDADYCWLLNNDTVVDPAALSTMVARMVEKHDAGMCGSTLRNYDDRSRIQALGGAVYFKWLGVAWHIGRTLQGKVSLNRDSIENNLDYIVGASLLVRMTFINDVGLMAEDYFLYFEEIDWVTRGQGRYGLSYAPDSVVYHKTGASIGTSSNPRKKSFLCDYYTLRNRLLFTRRYYPSVLGGVYAGLIIELIVRLLLGRWDLVRMICHLFVDSNALDKERLGADKAVL